MLCADFVDSVPSSFSLPLQGFIKATRITPLPAPLSNAFSQAPKKVSAL
jgi:hypothetical protein